MNRRTSVARLAIPSEASPNQLCIEARRRIMPTFYVRLMRTSIIATALVSIFAAGAAAQDDPPWSYSGTDGPASWSTLGPPSNPYSACGSPLGQSPVELLTAASSPFPEISSIGTGSTNATVTPDAHHHTVFFRPTSMGTLSFGDRESAATVPLPYAEREPAGQREACRHRSAFCSRSRCDRNAPSHHLVLSVRGVEGMTRPDALTIQGPMLLSPSSPPAS